MTTAQIRAEAATIKASLGPGQKAEQIQLLIVEALCNLSDDIHTLGSTVYVGGHHPIIDVGSSQ